MWWHLSTPSDALSWLLGLIDTSCYLLLRLLGDGRPKFFAQGWGPDTSVEAQNDFLERLQRYQEEDSSRLRRQNDNNKPFYDISKTIQWSDPVPNGSTVITKGQFPSPIADDLPLEAKMCEFFLVEPSSQESGNKEQDTSSPPKVVVIMLPATGEASKRARLNMAQKLALDHGWSSVIVTAPFYGARKPSGQKLFLIQTVNDFLNQSLAIMQEGAALASYFMQDEQTRVCLTGFSWGAAMSSCAASVALLAGCDGSRLACVPFVGCVTPAVLPDGLLQATIDWKAIQQPDSNEPFAATQQRLGSHLEEFNISFFTNFVEQCRQKQSGDKLSLGALKVVSMRHDHIIRRSWAETLVTELSKLTTSSTAILPHQQLLGGHVMAAVLKHRYQTNAIVEAVQEMLE